MVHHVAIPRKNYKAHQNFKKKREIDRKKQGAQQASETDVALMLELSHQEI